jgi:hypothetical protein
LTFNELACIEVGLVIIVYDFEKVTKDKSLECGVYFVHYNNMILNERSLGIDES